MAIKFSWFKKHVLKPLALFLLGKAKQEVDKWQIKPGVGGSNKDEIPK